MRSSYSDEKSSTDDSSSSSSSYDLNTDVCGTEDEDDTSDSDCSSFESEQGEPDALPCYDLSLEALMHAAEAGDLDGVDAALTKLSVSCSTLGNDGDTALHLASLFGHDAVVEKLLEAGADAAQPDNGGGLALHDACASGHLRIVERLLDASPDSIHTIDEDGDTALHTAARGDHLDIVRLLLKRGAAADRDVVNFDGERPRDSTASAKLQALLDTRCE